MNAQSPLEFITLRDTAGRASSLSIGGRQDKGKLVVVGGLPHCTQFEPDTVKDADKLIAWIQAWKEKRP